MLGWLFLAELARERRVRRARVRQRHLDEQAERQRLRAPEPGPEFEPEGQEVHRELRGPSARAVFWLAMIPVLPLAILAWVVDPWIFWIGILVLFAGIGATAPWWAE